MLKKTISGSIKILDYMNTFSCSESNKDKMIFKGNINNVTNDGKIKIIMKYNQENLLELENVQ